MIRLFLKYLHLLSNYFCNDACVCYFVQLPDYHEVIEHPMDFGTVRKNLAGGAYASLEQFEVGLAFMCLLTSLLLPLIFPSLFLRRVLSHF